MPMGHQSSGALCAVESKDKGSDLFRNANIALHRIVHLAKGRWAPARFKVQDRSLDPLDGGYGKHRPHWDFLDLILK